MFQRDYILRLVEQLAKTLGVVLTLKKARRFDEAELAIAKAAQNLIGLDVETLLALPVEQIVSLFSPSGSLDAGKCIVVAEILYEYGEIKNLNTVDICGIDATDVWDLTRAEVRCSSKPISGCL